MLKLERFKTFKQTLKNNSTHAKQLLWRHLRNRQLMGFKFRRQQILCNYIVDFVCLFVCLEKNLIIELDGDQHSEQVSYDNARTQRLNAEGFKVMRFWNNEVLQQTEEVLEVIRQHLVGGR